MKRFTETTIWEEDWFLDMPKEYKLLWFFIKDKCNHGGIWRPNLRLFEATIDAKVDLKKAIEYFNVDKVRCEILKSGHWFILDFFVFQYGETFNPANRVHKSIQDIYNQEKIVLTSIRGLKDLKDGVKDKDKDKEIIKEVKYIYNRFYDAEIERAKELGNENYPHFVNWLFKSNINKRPLNRVLHLSDQINVENFDKYIKLYGADKLKETILNMDNYTKKSYSSFNTTLNNWLKPKQKANA